MEIIGLMCWSIWTSRNDFIFRGIQPTLQHCPWTFKREFSLVIHRAKQKYFPLIRLSPTITPKIQDPFVIWVALQAKCSIHIQHLLQQQDLKNNPFCKLVFRREDAHICVVPLRQPKIGLPYRYSVGG